MSQPILLYYSADTRAASMLRPIRHRLQAQAVRLGFLQPLQIGARKIEAPARRLAAIDPKDRRRWMVKAENIYTRILAGLQNICTDTIVYLCEDDVLYADDHFSLHQVLPTDLWLYDLNLLYLTPTGFAEMHNRCCPSLSMSFGRAEILRQNVIRKLGELAAGTWSCFEPVGSQGYGTNHTSAPVASLDIRENGDHTWSVPPDVPRFQQEPGWPPASELLETYNIKEP